MTTREELINQFIKEHGQFIKEECERQKGNDFFLEQIWSDNMTDEVYELTEDGQGLVLLSKEEARKFKKSLKKDEIRNKINYERIKRYIQPFQIIRAHFPFTNKPNQYSERPILVVPISRNEYRFMMITTGAYTDVIYRRYEVLLHDWKEAGLNHSSYARTNILVDEGSLFFTSRFKIYGSLSDIDILETTKTLRLFRKEVFTNPIAFMYWLISHKITDTISINRDDNNNVNPIQSIYDIEKSGHANCVDLAIVVYKMCDKLKEFRPSTIASVSWVINDHLHDGHIFTLFKYRGNTYIFDYDQVNCVGTFPNYKSDPFDKAALSFSSSIKAEHPHEEVRRLSLNRQVIYVLDREDLRSVEDTSKYMNQREWLQDYSVLYRNTYDLGNDTILGIFYRVSYQGQGIYETLRKKVGWNWKTVKQDPDINWLPQPQVKEYKDTYKSYFTTLGYKVFQAKTMKVIDKYLDPNKIEVETFDELHGKLMYKDQYQVVVDQGDEIGMLREEAEYGTNWFISEDDIYLNWDKWEDGSAHLVFVNGLSGSGKSTLGRKISENYDAYYVELDIYGWKIVGQKAVDKGYTNYEYIKEKDRKLYEYMKAKHIPPDIFAKIDRWEFTKEEEEFKVREIEKYLYWLGFEQDERVVVEGGYTGVVMVRNPEMWKDTPIIFKGTSVTKSVFRRMCRGVKKDGPIGIYNVLKALKPQYIDHMIPETNASRKAMLSGRDDWEYVKESFTQIEADKSPHTRKKKLDLRKIPTKITDFKDFLRKIKTPEMVMKWFLKVKLRWTPHGGSNDHPFQWPDWLIKQRMGNCFDQSIFLHYFCRAKHIDHKMYLVTWLADNGQGTGHAVPLYKKGDKVYVFAYLNPKIGFIGGPFRSYGEAKRVLDNYFLMYINQFFKAPSTPYSSYLSDDDMANFDKYYNNRKITQTEYIIEGLGKNMRSSHLFKIKIKGFAFPNPILPAYDCIVAVFRTISTIYNFFTTNEEVDIDYGDEVETIEEDNDGIDRKYTRSYRNFDEFCQYIKTPQEVMNWYKINRVKWNKRIEGEFYKKPITWPDDMVKEKEGDCFDHAIFMHYFCDRNNIDNYIVRFVKYRALRVNNKWYFTHHFVCILKTDAGWVGFEYDSMPHDKPWGYDERNAMKSSLIGPYKTKEEAAKFFSDFYDYLFDQYEKNHRYRVDWEYRELIRCKTIFLNTKVINLIDKVYGDKSFTQEEFYNLVKSEMGDINYEGQSYESGCFFSDILNSLIVGANKIRSFREEESITEEEQLTEDDWIHDPSLMYRRSNKSKFDKIKNFNQFCREIDTPEEALSYFIIEKVRWSSMEEMTSINRPFYWPDDIIRNKIGVCMDQTLLMHQFYDYKGIENKSGFMIWVGEDNENHGSHIVPMFKRDGRIYCAVYLPNIGWIHGPFDSWTECVEETAKALASCSDLVQGIGKKLYTITEVVPDEFMKEADECSKHRKDITWYKFVTEDGCRRIRNTKLLNLHYKSISIWNPIVSVWNVIRFLRNNFGLDIPYYGLEEGTLLEEKLSADERRCFGLPKKKKYPMPDEAHVRAAIRFFNHCDPEDEEELARNIKKYMKKYNMKDVNVSDNNRFKKYYHPEESKEEKKPIKEETKPKITDKAISINNEAYDAYLYIRSCVNGARRSLGLLETSAAMGGPVVGMEINDQTVSYSNPGMFIVQYSDGNDTGYGITNDLKTKYFLRHDKKKNKLVKEDFSEFLKEKYFGIYSIVQEHRVLWNNLLTSFYEDPKCLTEDSRTLSLYEYFSGRKELVGDQIDYDENFNRVDPLWLDLMYNMKLQDPKMMNIPVINENYNGGDFRKHITLPQGIREFISSSLHSNELVLCEDPKGMYLLDENNNLVSRYITQEELEILTEVLLN